MVGMGRRRAKVRMLFAMLMMMATMRPPPMSVMIPHISVYGWRRAEWMRRRKRRKSICWRWITTRHVLFYWEEVLHAVLEFAVGLFVSICDWDNVETPSWKIGPLATSKEELKRGVIVDDRDLFFKCKIMSLANIYDILEYCTRCGGAAPICYREEAKHKNRSEFNLFWS